MSEVHHRLHPSHWREPKGYANGVAATGRVLYLGGQIGWNANQEFEGMLEAPESKAGGSAPFGFKLEGRELVEDKEELETCYYIFCLKLSQHLSLKDIADRLNREGRKTKRPGSKWHPTTVSNILKNEKLSSKFQFHHLSQGDQDG